MIRSSALVLATFVVACSGPKKLPPWDGESDDLAPGPPSSQTTYVVAGDGGASASGPGGGQGGPGGDDDGGYGGYPYPPTLDGSPGTDPNPPPPRACEVLVQCCREPKPCATEMDLCLAFAALGNEDECRVVLARYASLACGHSLPFKVPVLPGFPGCPGFSQYF